MLPARVIPTYRPTSNDRMFVPRLFETLLSCVVFLVIVGGEGKRMVVDGLLVCSKPTLNHLPRFVCYHLPLSFCEIVVVLPVVGLPRYLTLSILSIPHPQQA